MGKHSNNVTKFDTRKENPKTARSIGNRKKFHPQDLVSIQPKTERQREFFNAYNDETPIIANLGSAGTGKTFLALYAALSDVFNPAEPYSKVVICRSLVEVRKSGFLPGDLEAKYEPYEAVYKNMVPEMFKEFNAPYDLLKQLGYIEFMPTNFIRGMTLDNTILIVEECQNLDADELLSVLTRIGFNSRIILCGDGRQSDLERHRERSSFSYLRKVLDGLDREDAAVIDFNYEDIVRSELVKKIIIADEHIDK